MVLWQFTLNWVQLDERIISSPVRAGYRCRCVLRYPEIMDVPHAQAA